jgi:3-hydroxyisobutyrate dehydrogenase
MPTPNPRRVAFVGLGAMGSPMSQRLVDQGYVVVGSDVSEAARAQLAATGAHVTDRAADAARGADVVILMLPDSNVVDAVVRSEDFANALSPSTVVIDMSSSEPQRTKELSKFLTERGVALIDAPVSGGVAGARKGTLTVMVGGDDGVVASVNDVLNVFGRVMHVGPIGSGHAVKALNNLMSATHLLVTCEAILAGQRFGLDPEAMLSVFNTSSGRSGSTENKLPNFILPETYNSGFGLRLMLKDMKIAVQLAEQEGVPCELGRDAVELWSEAAEALDPNADHTEIARWLTMTKGSRES